MVQPSRSPAPRHRVYKEAAARLTELGLTVEILVQAVTDGDTGRAQCGPFHPKQSKGHRMWSDTTASLRRRCIARNDGWKLDHTGNLDTVANSDRGIWIAVVGGDKFTGIDDQLHDPKVARRRGPETSRRVARNARRFGMEPMDFDVIGLAEPDQEDGLMDTWFLMLRGTEERIWLELSSPIGMGDSGLVDRWRERILLPSIAADGGVTPIPDDDNDDDGRPPFSVEKK